MSADVLRRAAALMRERAEAAEAVFYHLAGSGTVPMSGGAAVVFEHYFAFPPAVALAVADWLDSHDAAHIVHDPRALTVARAYLGEA